MADEESITITLLFVNSIRQDITINQTFLQINNLPYARVKDTTIADIIGFLITNWQPKWGQRPLNIAQVRFIQLGRSLRTALSLADLNLGKSNVFHVNLRPVSVKESTNRRASLLVPTSHNKRTTRTFSNNGQPMTVNTTDDINFQLNPNGTTTLTGNANDITNYYNDRYGLTNVVGNRVSAYGNSPGNRGSYISNSRQRLSYLGDPTIGGSSSQSYSINRNYRRYSEDSSEEEDVDDDELDIVRGFSNDELDSQFYNNGTLRQRGVNGPTSPQRQLQLLQPPEFHHVITTDRGRREQEAREKALQQQQQQQQQQQNRQSVILQAGQLRVQQQSRQQQQQQQQLRHSLSQSGAKNSKPQPPPGGGGCCVIM